MSDPAPTELPHHIEESVQTLASLHREHYSRLSPVQKLLDAATAGASRPRFLMIVLAAAAAWVAINLGLKATGRPPFDPPPFQYLQGLVTLGALIMTCLILSTQSREDQIANRRQQLTLELSILAEQKAAKAIELLEALRRDTPMVEDRHDQDAVDMSTPADPRLVLDAIRDSHEDDAPTSALDRS